MQGYFSWINALLIGITRVPLPEDKSFTRQELDELSSILLLQIGITLDNEINGLLAHLETLIVDSVYKLDLKRPRKSMTRNGMLNPDMIKILRELESNTLLGLNREKYFALMIMQVYSFKGIGMAEADLEQIAGQVFDSQRI